MLRKTNITRLLLLALITLVNAQTALAIDHTPDYYEFNIRDNFRNERWEAGKVILDEAMPMYGDLSVMQELQGWYYCHFKQYVKARYHLVKSLRDDSSNTHARELLVKVEEETKNYSSAICYVNEILETDPYSRVWWRKKISLYRQMGNHQEADRLLYRLNQIYPHDQNIKDDIYYQNEMKLASLKSSNDIDAQIRILNQLTSNGSNNPDYYIRLVNLLLQQGRTQEAAEVAAQGARATHSTELVKKHVGILLVQGHYQEAAAFVNECQKDMHLPGLASLINNIDEEAAYGSIYYDTYTMFGKLYEKQHSADALNYLLNTSISRGYYDDALYYLNEKRKGGVETEEVLYKMYVVNKRMGNTRAANNILERLVTLHPTNVDAVEDLCTVYYEHANQSMQVGDYNEAIPQLLFIAEHSTDSATRHSANTRLFTCYLEQKNYHMAAAHLDSIRSIYGTAHYATNMATILHAQRRTEDALSLLYDTYMTTDSADIRQKISATYEEIAQPYIKNLIEQGLYRKAYRMAVNAIDVCPSSMDLLRQAISMADALGYRKEHEELVTLGLIRFPGDPYFIVKESILLANDGDYKRARDRVRPLVEYYVGDSTISKAYASHSEQLALQQLKKKKPIEAMYTVNDALSFMPDHKQLRYTKGLIFESLHQYDSAFIYQKHYIPSAMEIPDFRRHLEELLYRRATHQLIFDYQHAVNSANDKRTGNASVTYARTFPRNKYIFTLNYAGRDGRIGLPNDSEDTEGGGLGLQGTFGWEHRFRPNRKFNLGASLGSKFFPLATLKGGITFELRNDWEVTPRVSARVVTSYKGMYGMAPNPSYDPKDPTSLPEVNTFFGWKKNRRYLFSAGCSATKGLGQFALTGNADAFYMAKRFFFTTSGKMSFFPVEGRLSNFYATGGVGTAPEAELIDNAMPSSFSHLNSFVGMGALLVINRSLSFVGSGTWFTLYSQSETLMNDITVNPKITTKYLNFFYLNAQVLINF